jgi:multicomponent Na+:H+ antiporter subunit G
MLEILIALLMFSGSFFTLIASVGLLRMPDLFMRLSATTKAATLGAALVLAAVAGYFRDMGVTGQALAVIAFLMLTAPVAAHMIARAAYFNRLPLWEGSCCDDLRERLVMKAPTKGDMSSSDSSYV